MGGFLAAGARLQQISSALHAKHVDSASTRSTQPFLAMRELGRLGLVDQRTALEIEELRRIRNEVVHGKSDYKSALTREMVARVSAIADKLEKLLQQ